MKDKHNHLHENEHDHARRCPECRGSGYDPLDGGQCERCAGTGMIDD